LLQSIAIIYNPRAGKKLNEDIYSLLEREFKSVDFQIFVWDENKTIEEFEKIIIEKKFIHVIAAGGDGTVNRVAKFAQENDLVLGIIPLGSGNGLSRSLGQSIQIHECIQNIKKNKIKQIDSAFVNGKNFFCTSGVGFDAHVGKLFSLSSKRGFWSYFKITLRELISYRTKKYVVSNENIELETEAFLITVCNAGQWGNNFYIAPLSQLDDGILDAIIVKPFPIYAVPLLVYQLLRKKIHHSKYVKIIAGKNLSIKHEGLIDLHYDGEPDTAINELKFSIKKRSLKVLC
jgi:YegS/Rv2252/BmrU family lipid kinase